MYKSSVADVTPPFIYSDRGRCLYEHKRKGNFMKWAHSVVNGLRKAGFSEEYIRAAPPTCLTTGTTNTFTAPRVR